MRRKLFIGAISLVSLILLLLLGVVFYIRSGRLDRFLKEQVVEALADVGIAAEIGKVQLDIRGYRVTLEDIKLSAADGKNRFGTIDKLTADFSVLSYLHQRIKITNVEIVHPHAWIEVDKQGGFNLASLHAPSKQPQGGKGDKEIFQTASFRIT